MDGCTVARGKRPQASWPTEAKIQSAVAPPLPHPLDARRYDCGPDKDRRASNGRDGKSPFRQRGSRGITSTRKAKEFATRKQEDHVLICPHQSTSRLASSGGGYGGRGQDGDDSENDDNGAGSTGMPRPKGQRQHQMLACPFYKFNSIRHLSCARMRLSRIRDVKQHLIRRHRRPPYCPVCGETFNDSQRCDSHIKARTCNAPPGGAKIEGVTETQRVALTGRVNRTFDEASQWFSVWEILFPNTSRPLSPYLSTQFGEVLDIFHDYWERQRDTLIAEVAAEVVQSVSSGSGSDQGRIVKELSSRIIEQLFSRFRTTSQTIKDPAPFEPATQDLSLVQDIASRTPPASVPSPAADGVADGGGTETVRNSTVLHPNVTSPPLVMDVSPPADISTVLSPNTSSASSNSDYNSTSFSYPEDLYGPSTIPVTQPAVGPLGADLVQTGTLPDGGLNLDFQGLGSFAQDFPDVTNSNFAMRAWTDDQFETFWSFPESIHTEEPYL